jgi:hypothetical protein
VAPAVPSWSCFVRKVWIDKSKPRKLLTGHFFADEDDTGERSWELCLILRRSLDDVADDEVAVVFETDNDQRFAGFAEITEVELNAPKETRYELRGTGPLNGFDWSVLE